MKIVPLHTRPELAGLLAEWHYREWRHLYATWDWPRAQRELAHESSTGALPQTFLALRGVELLGSISLVYDDLPGWEHLNPWVASFYLVPAARGRGLGAQLLSAAEEHLRKLQISQAYVFTELQSPYFEKRGWRIHAAATAHQHPVTILTKSFTG